MMKYKLITISITRQYAARTCILNLFNQLLLLLNSLTDEMQSSEPNSTHQPVIDLASNTQ